jgi:hypothetical protein
MIVLRNRMAVLFMVVSFLAMNGWIVYRFFLRLSGCYSLVVAVIDPVQFFCGILSLGCVQGLALLLLLSQTQAQTQPKLSPEWRMQLVLPDMTISSR